MDELKKLFQAKRILAMMLAAAMVITMMPTTANAASVSANAAGQADSAQDSLQTDQAGQVSYHLEDQRSEDWLIRTTYNERDAKTGVSYSGFESALYYIYVIEEADGIVTNKGNLANSSDCTTEWQIKKGEEFESLPGGSKPIQAGEYRLLVTFTDGSTDSVPFYVEPMSTRSKVSLRAITPGTKVSSVTEEPSSLIGSLYFYGDDGSAVNFTTDLGGLGNPYPALVTIGSVQIKNIYGDEVDSNAELRQDEDYSVEISFEYNTTAENITKTNYELPETISKLITIGDLIVPDVVVDLGTKKVDENGTLVDVPVTELERTYTGEAVKEPEKGTEYTVKVELDEQAVDQDGKPVTDEDGNPVKKEIPITDDNFATSWYEGYEEYDDDYLIEANKLKAAPVEAGDYTYLLTYEGQKGIYGKAFAKIHVVINPIALTIEPTINDVAFKSGMKVKDVLAEVDYNVLKADGTPLEIDRNYFWGTVSFYDTTQPYEPVFGVQIKEKTIENITEDGKTETVDIYGDGRGNGKGYLSSAAVLQSGAAYRVIFTGNKAVYGDGSYSVSINNGSDNGYDEDNGFNTNYQVDVTDETKEKYAVAVKMEASKAAVISAEEILKKHDGKGASYENPITKVYDEKRIYDRNVDYKLAVVTPADGGSPIAQKVNSAIGYTWERQEGMEPVYDEDGNEIGQNPQWVKYDFDRSPLNKIVSPVNAGKYRLTISYDDSKNSDKNSRGYSADEIYVFYEIKPQLVRITLPDEGKYDTMTGIAVWQYITFLDKTHEVYAIAEDKKSERKLDWPQIYDDESDEYYDPYELIWYVEKAVSGDEWIELEEDDVFEKDVKYRLRVAMYLLGSYGNNYIDYEEITIGTGADQKTQYVDYHDTKPINVEEMGTTELTVITDPTKLTTKEKVYDGIPVTTVSDINNGLVTVVKKDDAAKTPVTDAQVAYIWYGEYEQDYETRTEAVVNPVNAGKYTLYAFFDGDTTYKAFDGLLFNTGITLEIKQRELTVKPVVEAPVVAGTELYQLQIKYGIEEIENIAPSDRDAFAADCSDEVWAIGGYGIEAVYDAEGNHYSGKFKGNTEYTLRLHLHLNEPFDRNYTNKSAEVKFTTVHSNSTVEGTKYLTIPAYKMSDPDKASGTHTVTAKEGIKYLRNVTVYDENYNSEVLEGNLIALKITVPAEYDYLSDAEAIYENSIKNAGGRIVKVSNGYRNSYITVVFNAADGKEEPIGFDIRWEEGFVEHFKLDFSKAELLEDLRKAVSPKSLSFIKPNTKMTVGDEQSLDVKIATSQIGDLVHLSYEVDKPNVLCVDEYGTVTALAVGDATITVRSTKLDENGEYVPTTPEKKATVKIKVSEVTAPKIKKIENTTDEKAVVKYSPVTDGYRREIYVLEGKTTYTKDDFETKVSSMKNGNWEAAGFAIEPVYYGNEYVDSKTKTCSVLLSGLKTDKEYTVYVRNVSNIRTLKDGCKVAESHNGSVKGFRTTKSQVQKLALSFKDEGVTYTSSYGDNDYAYSVELKKGTTVATVSGYFYDWLNDAGDYDWKDLPLSKEDQRNYVNPKLEFAVGDLTEYAGEGYIGCYYDEYDEEYYYLYKTSLASIDKKGKLKLNGVGIVDVVVRDSNTGRFTSEEVIITATANDIVGKNVKLQVGQRIGLEDLLTYKEDKKVLNGDFTREVVLDDALRTAIDESESFELQGRYVVAVKAGDLSLTLKDAYVGDKTVTTKLKATALEPIKNLKATTVTDQHFDIEFTHSLKPYTDSYTDGLGFRIKVTDARGTLLRSAYVKADSAYNEETQKYEYRMTGLTKKSKYNVTVTAEFKGEASRETKKAITTTLLPASYVALPDKYSYEYNYYNQGIGVYVHGYEYSTIYYWGFVTGNSYTLEVGNSCGNGQFNEGAKAAMTDTLTWTSSNTKVATVKANAGSYSASLKAVGAGKTTIEVKSKITKAVIARYTITVNTVGNAYDCVYDDVYYSGEDEYLKGNTVPDLMSFALKNGVEMLCQ